MELRPLHIGIIGESAPDKFGDNVRDTLEKMGHRASMLGSGRLARGGLVGARVGDLAMRGFPRLEERFHVPIARKALALECDAVINTIGNLSPSAVEVLADQRIPTAFWFPDHVANLDRQRVLLAPYTAWFFKDPLLVTRLRDTLGLPVWYLPEACNPDWHRPIDDGPAEPVVVVAGNLYPSRLVLLKRLHEAGVPIRIYGPDFPRWARGIIPDELHTRTVVLRENKSRLFRRAAAVLNNLHPAEMEGVNGRLFQATGAGAAVLCEQRPALSELFDVEREVAAFRTFDDLVSRARDLLADPEVGRQLGDAASKRAHAEHTYEIRLNTILEKLA